MRRINTKKSTGIWIDFPSDDTFKLKIRPLNLLSLKAPAELSGGTTKQYEIFEWFDYVLLDWSGYNDEEGQVVECTKEMKEVVFNFDQEVVAFVISKATELRDEIVSGKEAENLGKSQGGEEIQSDEKSAVKIAN